MLAYAIAATPTERCTRAGISVEALRSYVQRAEAAGARQDLERYLDSEGRDYGLVSGHLFVPTAMMLAFREEAKRAANRGRPDVVAHLPCFDEWFLDSVLPTLHSGRRQELMRAFTESGDIVGRENVQAVVPTQADDLDWMPLNDGVEKAQRAGLEIATLSNIFKWHAAGANILRDPRLPGRHKKEVNWPKMLAIAVDKSQKNNHESEENDDSEVARRIELARQRRSEDRPLS
jgi:hypothetical protein